jgi:hypothetical protein
LKIESDKGSVSLSAGSANIDIAEGCSAIVTSFPARGSVKISVLSCGKNVVTVRAKGVDRSIELHKNEQLTIENGRPDEPHAFKLDELKTENSELFAESSGHPMRILGDDSTMFRVSGQDAITLRRGELFLLATYPIRIRTTLADVFAAKAALVDVTTEDKEPEMRVKSFNEPVQVSVAESPKPIEVKQSQELLLCAGELTDDKLIPPDGIGRRRNQKLDLGKNLHGAFSDFSMASFLEQSAHVTIIKHPISSSDKDLHDKFFKSAAAVQTISNQYGPYRAAPKLNRKRPETKNVQPGA